jgi:uncharacterized protein (TIGR00299 family) protein
MRKRESLYLECSSGISGDMTVAALLDLGADERILREGLESLNVPGYEIEISRIKKSGIDVCDFNVILEEAHSHGQIHEGHCHEQNHKEHGHSHDESYDHEHAHNDGGHQDHEHMHTHAAAGHHEHRNLGEIHHIIDHGKMSIRAKELAKKIFTIVAEAESKAHGLPVDQVHFHEVGAVDSIVDIVGTAICLDNLNIENVIVKTVCEGSGFVRCQHGMLPVPVPAVVNIVSGYGIPLKITDTNTELVTPTGAAILAATVTAYDLPEKYAVKKIGIGAGKKETGGFNALRAMLIEEVKEEQKSSKDWILETNIDDCSGENLSYTMELLFEAGALDVYYTPIYMKKNRPAYKVSILCEKERIDRMEEILFQNTTTIGIRSYEVNRTKLARTIEERDTPWGKVRVKCCVYKGEQYCYPEYESVREIARKQKRSYKEVYHLIKSYCEKTDKKG